MPLQLPPLPCHQPPWGRSIAAVLALALAVQPFHDRALGVERRPEKWPRRLLATVHKTAWWTWEEMALERQAWMTAAKVHENRLWKQLRTVRLRQLWRWHRNRWESCQHGSFSCLHLQDVRLRASGVVAASQGSVVSPRR